MLAAVLFAIGTVGALTRRNGIAIFLSIELMLNAGNLALVAYARLLGDQTGQMVVFFVLAVAAAEAAVGLALFIAVYRQRQHHRRQPHQPDALVDGRAIDCSTYLWLIPLLPLAGAALNGLLGPRAPKRLVTAVGVGAPVPALLVALGCLWQYVTRLQPRAVRADRSTLDRRLRSRSTSPSCSIRCRR